MYTWVPFRSHFSRELSTPFSIWVGAAGFRVDIRQEPEAHKLEAELPEASKDKSSITLDDNILVISADLNEEKTEERGAYLYSERRCGHVERRFNMDGIDACGIQANYESGALLATLPKEKTEEKT